MRWKIVIWHCWLDVSYFHAQTICTYNHIWSREYNPSPAHVASSKTPSKTLIHSTPTPLLHLKCHRRTPLMAHSAFLLRRSVPAPTALRRSLSSLVPALSSPPLLKPSISSSSPSSQQQASSFLASVVQSRLFRSYPTVSLSSDKKYHLYKEGDEITPDTILFEGCDYNHWLIVMEFPKDPKPTPEEMVRTYEETCAKGLNIRYFFFLISRFNFEYVYSYFLELGFLLFILVLSLNIYS